MKWSYKIGRIAGIDTYVHATFLLLLGFVWLSGGAAGAAFVAAVFFCVLLHELGHALAARRFGIATRDITLLPIGGVARLERMPEDPRQELAVALAGPAVNVGIAALLAAALAGVGMLRPMGDIAGGSGDAYLVGGTAPFLQKVMAANVTLVLFNLIPAFPMDGGRVLRALLAMRMPYAQATRAAATLGQGIAVLFGLYGIFGPQHLLILVALFVWIGAEGEAQAVSARVALGGAQARDAALSEFHVLDPGAGLGKAVELTLSGSQKDFPVVGPDGRFVGLLSQRDLMRGLHEGGLGAPVERYMAGVPSVAVGDPREPLHGAYARLQASGLPMMPLIGPSGRLVALLTLENVGEYLMLQAALGRPSTPPVPRPSFSPGGGPPPLPPGARA